MGRHSSQLALLAACAAAGVASAQLPQPALSPPADDAGADAVTPERRNVSDAQLGLEVQVHLFQELNVSNLSALVRYGVATLAGTVNTEADRQRAEQITLSVPGVKSVANELRVADPVIVAITRDAEALAKRESTNIEAEVAARLSSDATLGSRLIVVKADGPTNTVTLTGTVSTEEEKERASALAVSAFPSGQVRNRLEVRQRL